MVSGDLAEALAVAPVAGRVDDVLGGGPHEVPPHHHRLVQRFAAEQEQLSVCRGGQRHLIPPGGQVQQGPGGERGPVSLPRPGHHEDHVLVARLQAELAAGVAARAQLGAHHRGEDGGRGAHARQRPGEHGDLESGQARRGQLGMVLEGRRHVPLRAGQGQPELDAVQPRVMLAGRFLGMGDSPPCGHQVELAGPDHLLTAQAVAVQHVPVQQPGDGLQADVRVRRHLHPGHAVHRHRAVVVHEAPGADAAPAPQRQQPADLDVPDPGYPPRGQLARGQLTWLAVRARRIRDGHIRVGSAHVPILRRGFCPAPAGQPTSVLTAAVSSVSAPLASEKNMLVFGSTYSSLSMPA